MATVRPVTKGDAQQVASFVHQHFGSNVEKQLLRFSCSWSSHLDRFGYVLDHDEKIVGYIGAVYAERDIGGQKRVFANMADWAVLPEYRKYSLKLLQAMLAEPDVTFTNFSASKDVAAILPRFGFETLETTEHIVFLWSAVPKLWQLTSMRFQDRSTKNLDSSIVDHLDFGAVIVWLNDTDYALFMKKPLTKGSGAKVLYTTNPELLVNSIGAVNLLLARKLGTIAIAIDRRFTAGIGYFKDKKRPSLMLYKSSEVSCDEIDWRYSEIVFRFRRESSKWLG